MAKSIAVGNDLVCSTYTKVKQQDSDQMQDVSKTMAEQEPNIHAYRHNKEIDIVCNASHCLFNDCKNCKANGITVTTDNKPATCITHIYK